MVLTTYLAIVNRLTLSKIPSSLSDLETGVVLVASKCSVFGFVSDEYLKDGSVLKNCKVLALTKLQFPGAFSCEVECKQILLSTSEYVLAVLVVSAKCRFT